MPQGAKRIHVGTIVAAHGVRGQVKLKNLLDSEDTLLSLKDITDRQGARQFKLTRRGQQKDILLVSIEGVTDRNEAELLKGMELYAPAGSLPELPDDSWYHADLVGLNAITEDGNAYGTVIAVHNFGAGDVIEIDTGEGKTEMLPFKEPFVGEVMPEEGTLRVRLPEYLEPEGKHE